MFTQGGNGPRSVGWSRWGGAILLGALGAVALAAPSSAGDDASARQKDLDCGDFRYQEDAQAHLDADRSDPDRLDADNDGIACESNPHRPGGGGGPDPTVPAPVAPRQPALRCRPPAGGEMATNNSVARLYEAYFLRDADGGGLGYWVPKYRSGELCLTDISGYFAQSQEFVGTYGPLDDPGFVRLVYVNVMGREPDPAGYTYWAQALSGGMPRGAMMIGFSESAEFRSRSGLA